MKKQPNWRKPKLIKILCISGSPVAESSTELLLKRISDSLGKSLRANRKIHLDFHRLNELMYLPCQACGHAPTPNFCFFDDALSPIYKQLAECDCFLIGSPVYFDAVSAQTKAFMDRCNCFRPPDYNKTQKEHRFIKLLKYKRPGAMVLVGDKEGWFEGPRRSIAGFFKWIEVASVGALMFHSEDFSRKAAALDDPKILDEADKLGKKLSELLIKADAEK